MVAFGARVTRRSLGAAAALALVLAMLPAYPAFQQPTSLPGGLRRCAGAQGAAGTMRTRSPPLRLAAQQPGDVGKIVPELSVKLRAAAQKVAQVKADAGFAAEAQRAEAEGIGRLLDGGGGAQTRETAIEMLVRASLDNVLEDADMSALWRRTALTPRAITDALRGAAMAIEGGAREGSTAEEVQQAYGLVRAAQVLGLSLGHADEALLLLSEAHLLLASRAGGWGAGGDGAGADGGVSWAAMVLGGGEVRDSVTGERQREGEEAMVAVVDISLMEAEVVMRTGDYKGAYEKQTTAIALLSLIAQTSARKTSVAADSDRGGGTEGRNKLEVRLAQEVARQASMLRELGMPDEAVLVCRRLLLSQSLTINIPESPDAPDLSALEEEWKAVDPSSPYRSVDRATASLISNAMAAPDAGGPGGEVGGMRERVDVEMVQGVARVRSELARALQQVGSLDEALQEARVVMHMLARAVGEQDVATVDAIDLVGQVLQAQQRFEAAADMHSMALAWREEASGAMSLQATTSLALLAAAREGAGDRDEAVQLLERCVAIARAHFPDAEGHGDIASRLVQLANTVKEAGDWARARALLEEASQMFVASVGYMHPQMAGVLSGLAAVAEEEGDFDRALILHQQSLGIKKERLGAQHASVATSLVNMARTHEKLGDLATAVELRIEALSIVRASLGENHPQTAIMLNNVSVLEARRGNYAEAAAFVQEALAIDEAVFGENHPQVAADLNTLATLAFHCGEKHLARQLYERAVAIRREALGDEHVRTRASQKNLDLVKAQIAADDAADDGAGQ